MFLDRNKTNLLESEPHQFCVEASELGLPPGPFPQAIETNLGNGQPLLIHRIERSAEGELGAVKYRQQFGCTCVTIWND